MALYSLEIIEKPRNPKALAIIANLAQIHQEEAKRRLHRIPMIVQAAIQLSDAVSIQRQLSRVGVQTRIFRSDVSIEDPSPQEAPPPKSSAETEEIIEIPDGEVTVIEHAIGPKPRIVVGPPRTGGGSAWRRYALPAIAGLIFLIAGSFIYSFHQSSQRDDEITASLEAWNRTLQDQDNQLDHGVTAESIARKLAEIEKKLEVLWNLQTSKARAEALRSEFARMHEQARADLQDLNFRLSLEKAAVPLNPTCSLDQGRVRGYSNLPDGARLRIRLFGDPSVESVSYSAQVRDKVFELVLDPSIEGRVYDARATIAPFTQQSPPVQAWAQLVFDLEPELPAIAVKSRTANSGRLREDQPEFSGRAPDGIETSATFTKRILDELSAAPDSLIAETIARALDQWDNTIQEAPQNFGAGGEASLEAIYQRLLNLEARIDLMIELLQSANWSDSCILWRDQTYGAYADLRQELGGRHQDFLSLRSPGYLESRLQRAFRDSTAGRIQVIVFDSPRRESTFTIAIESTESVARRKHLWPMMVNIIAHETEQSLIEIDAVRYRDAAGAILWPLEQIQEAAQAMREIGTSESCLDILKYPQPIAGTP